MSNMLIDSVLFFAVDSNDSLYAGDPKFVGKVSVLVSTLISQILDHLKTLAHPEEVRMYMCVCAIIMTGKYSIIEPQYNDYLGTRGCLVRIYRKYSGAKERTLWDQP